MAANCSGGCTKVETGAIAVRTRLDLRVVEAAGTRDEKEVGAGTGMRTPFSLPLMAFLLRRPLLPSLRLPLPSPADPTPSSATFRFFDFCKAFTPVETIVTPVTAGFSVEVGFAIGRDVGRERGIPLDPSITMGERGGREP